MRTFVIATLCMVSALMAQDNLLVNPGFEEVDDQGRLVGWSDKRPVYTQSSEYAKTGKYSLKFENHDKDNYVLLSQKIDLEKDSFYEFSVWVKTMGMKGNGPTVCVEYSDKDGNYVGGVYPGGAQETNGEWKLVRGFVRNRPEKAVSFSITVYCRQGSAGVAWFDDVVLRKFTPPMLRQMTSDHYRNITAGTPLKVFAGLSISKENHDKIKQSGVSLKLTDEAGKEIGTFTASAIEATKLAFDVPTKDLKTGNYLLSLSLKNPHNGETEVRTLKFKRVDAIPQRKSYIDSHRRLILDGKPFFPLGMYFGDVKPNEIDIYKDSAFNCLMPYTMISREKLDNAYKNGIKVIYSVKDIYPNMQWSKIPNWEEAAKQTREKMEAVMDHPGIIAWYINDELPISRLDELTAKRDLVEEIDPGRPAWVVLYQINEVTDYLPTFDIIGTDPYPIPTKSPSMAYDWAVRTTQGGFECHANWMVPQVFNWASYWGGYGRSDAEVLACRAPTFQEMKSMAWMCIAGGANGLIFYSWFDLHKMNKLKGQGGVALRVDPFDVRWAEVKRMAADIGRLDQVLLSIEKPLELKEVSGNADIAWRSFGKDGETWLLLVNSSEKKACDAAFEAPVASLRCVGTDLGEAKPVIEGNKLKITLEPLEVVFLRLK